MTINTNQGARQATIRNLTGRSLDYRSDWIALFDLDALRLGVVDSATFNGRLLNWLNNRLHENYTDLTVAKMQYASKYNFYNWSAITAIANDWMVSPSTAKLQLSTISAIFDVIMSSVVCPLLINTTAAIFDVMIATATSTLQLNVSAATFDRETATTVQSLQLNFSEITLTQS
jgi:hypothetical protein